MATTIYDIAEEVSVSYATVSMALRGSSKISKKTKAKVLSAAERLRYKPNRLACGLIGAKTKTVACVYNYSAKDFSHDLAYLQLFHCITQAATKKNYNLFLHSSQSSKSIAEVLNEVDSCGIDGIILNSDIDDNDKSILHDSKKPVVVIGRDFKANKVSSVIVDDDDGIRQVINHLLSLGHRRIAFAGKHPNETALKRFQGYCNALRKADLNLEDELIFECTYCVMDGRIVGDKIAEMKTPPTAICTGSDLLAMGIIMELKNAQIAVPQDISVTGNNNFFVADSFSPSITTLDRINDKFGEVVMESLLKLINGQVNGESIMTRAELVKRKSTAIAKYNNYQKVREVTPSEDFTVDKYRNFQY